MSKLWTSLKLKMAFILILQILFLCILITGTFHAVMLGSIHKLEKEYLIENVDLVKNAIEYKIAYLDSLAYDWGVWDDTYFFLQGSNKNYVEDNLYPESIINIGVQIMSYVDPIGDNLLTVINSNGTVDYDKNALTVNEEIKALMVLMKQHKTDVSGLVLIEDKPYVFSLIEVEKSDGSGPNVGYLFLALEVNDAFLNELNQQYKTHASVELYASDVKLFNIPDDITKDEITNSSLLNDVFGNPKLKLKVTISRQLYKIANGGLKESLSIIIISIILFGAFVYFFWYKEVISRLLALKKYVQQLKANKLPESTQRHITKTPDEIDVLQNEVIVMYYTIFEQGAELRIKQSELEALNETLEQQVEQRTLDLIEINKQVIQSEKNYRTIVDEFPDLIFVLNEEHVFLACEGGLQNQLLVPKESFIGKKLEQVLSAELSELLSYNIQKAYREKTQVDFKYEIVNNKDIYYYKAKLIPQESGELFAFISDVTAASLLHKEIELLSYNDQLTGLYNRRFINLEFERLFTKRNLPFSALAIDVNGLKMMNDAFGHLVGDTLLCEVAKVIKKNLRSEDVVARMGGDEFAVLLPKTSEVDCIEIMNRMRKDVSLIVLNGIESSISIGSCTVLDVTMSFEDIFKSADEKMYTQKSTEYHEIRSKTVVSMLENLFNINESEKLHNETVYKYALKIGEALKLSDIQLHDLGLAAKYHDIGKLGVPSEILMKNSALSGNEYEKIKRHSEIGFQIMNSVDSFKHIAESVHHHHENWDGSGYPNGLSDNKIPLYSRIIRVADAYASMIHDRSDKMSIEETLRELNRYAGKYFDLEVVNTFSRILNEY